MIGCVRMRLGLAAAASTLALASAAGAAAVPAGAVVSAAAASQPVTFDVYLPVQNSAALDSLLQDLQNSNSPSYHKWLTPAQFNARFGPTSAQLAAASSALSAQGLAVVGASGRAVTVSATAAQVSRVFSTSLSNVQASGTSHLVANSTLTLPAPLKSMGAVVTAFSGFHVHTHSKVTNTVSVINPNNRYSPAGGYWFDDLKQAYGYPSYQKYDGTGVNVAVLMSSDALDSDIAQVFNHEKFSTVTGKPAPTITHQAVNQAKPVIDANGVYESSLDVQEVLGGAPGAAVTLVDIPSLSDQDITAGYTYIVNATKADGSPKFQLVNSSFGGCELFYTAAYNDGVDDTSIIKGENDLFRQGNAEGITFVASSGDSGGLGCPDTNYFAYSPSAPSRFLAGVEFPASSPYVTAVGGGNVITSYSSSNINSTYVAENANGDPETLYDPYGVGVNVSGGYWGAGGGVSSVFGKPAYQGLVNTGSTSLRTLPDIGMQVGGCPGGIAVTPCGPNRSYVYVAVQGGYVGLIGTSVASPEFVGALALYVQKQGGLGQGDMNTYLYTQAAAQNAGGATVYNRYIPGFDGKYTNSYPSGGYNYLVGNGTPQVASLLGLGTVLAGTPQTASNP